MLYCLVFFFLKIFFTALTLADLTYSYCNACVAWQLRPGRTKLLQSPQQCTNPFTTCSLFLLPLPVAYLFACSPHTQFIFKPALCWQPLWGKALFASSQQQLADGNTISVWDEALNFCPVTCRWQRRVLSTVQMQTDQMWQNVSFAW